MPQSIFRSRGEEEDPLYQGVRTISKAIFNLSTRVPETQAEARDFADRIDSKIVLIDGEMLVNLMIDNGGEEYPWLRLTRSIK